MLTTLFASNVFSQLHLFVYTTYLWILVACYKCDGPKIRNNTLSKWYVCWRM